MSDIRVSVLVPVYKVEAYIERCAVSLFEQTYPCLEFIFVDDCTPDRSMDVLRETMARYPDRAGDVRIIRHETNMGLAAARKTGVDAATGEYIMFMDSDDWMEKDIIEKSLLAATESGADMAIANIVQHFKRQDVVVAQPKTETPQEFFHLVLSGDAPSNLFAKIYRNTLLKDHAYSRLQGISFAEDYLLLPQIVRHVSKIAYLDEALYHYDCRNSNTSSHIIADKTVDTMLAIQALFRSLFPDARSKEALDRGMPKKMVILMKEFCVSFERDEITVGRRIVREMSGMDLSGLSLPNMVLYWLCRADLFRTAGVYVRLMRGIKRPLDQMRTRCH